MFREFQAVELSDKACGYTASNVTGTEATFLGGGFLQESMSISGVVFYINEVYSPPAAFCLGLEYFLFSACRLAFAWERVLPFLAGRSCVIHQEKGSPRNDSMASS